MKCIINEDNLFDVDIDVYKNKVRAMLLDGDNILVSSYVGIALLPGGSIETNELQDAAIIRELLEETGIEYDIDELHILTTIDYYQKNYPMRDSTLKNRLVRTHYYIGKYKGISLENQKLSDNEKNNNFTLKLLPISKLKEILMNNKSSNPRNPFFSKELLSVIDEYEKSNKVYKK